MKVMVTVVEAGVPVPRVEGVGVKVPASVGHRNRDYSSVGWLQQPDECTGCSCNSGGGVLVRLEVLVMWTF